MMMLIFGINKVTVDVGGHTRIDGAVLASDKNDLKLTTQTLEVTTIKDHDTGTSIAGQVGVTTPGTPGKAPGVTVSGDYATHTKEGESIGTIGGGKIVVKDQATSTPVDQINRDTDHTQVVTKDESAGTKVYASDTSIKTAIDGIKVVGKTLSNVLEEATIDLGRKGEIPKDSAERVGSIFKGIGSKNISLDQIVGCTNQAGFNFHDIVFSRAYASGCAFEGKDGKKYSLENDGERALCFTIFMKGTQAKIESGDTSGMPTVSDIADAIRKGDKEYGIGGKSVTEIVTAWGEFKHELLRGAVQAKFGETGLADFDAVMIQFAQGVTEIKDSLDGYISEVGKSKGLSNKEISDLKYVAGAVFIGVQAVVGAKNTAGFSHDSVSSAYKGMSGSGGHAIRHLMADGLIPSNGSLSSRVTAFENATSHILTSPASAFDYKVGNTSTRAFLGNVEGKPVAVFVAKDGLYQGKVITAFVPTAEQLKSWGVK